MPENTQSPPNWALSVGHYQVFGSADVRISVDRSGKKRISMYFRLTLLDKYDFSATDPKTAGLVLLHKYKKADEYFLEGIASRYYRGY
jgi:hypothetical protein